MQSTNTTKYFWKNIQYLALGNKRQKDAFDALNNLDLFKNLDQFDPVLTGTIPIGIDLPESDLDIICFSKDLSFFYNYIEQLYNEKESFSIKRKVIKDAETVICSFNFKGWRIEIFGQAVPVTEQYAYRHMVIEHEVLMKFGSSFRKEIIRLKQNKLTTEEAFAKLLGLEGDPYEELLNYDI